VQLYAEVAKKGGPIALKEVSLPLRGTRGGSVKIFIGAAPPPRNSSGGGGGGGGGGGMRTPGRSQRRSRRGGSVTPRGGAGDGDGEGATPPRAPPTGEESWGEDFEDSDSDSEDDGADDVSDDDSDGEDDDDALLDDSDQEEGDGSSSIKKKKTKKKKKKKKKDDAALGRSASDLADGVGVRETSASVSHLMQIAKLQMLRTKEIARHLGEQSAAMRKAQVAKEDLAMERERRQFELRRALIEGAVFYCHTKRKPGFEPGTYRLWYNSAKRQMMWCSGTKSKGKSKLHQFVPVSLIKECVVGTSAFTLGAQSENQQRKSAASAGTVAEAILSKSPTATAMASAQAVSNIVARKIGNHDPLRCFALVLWRPESEVGLYKFNPVYP
jgi:hypothetical protein